MIEEGLRIAVPGVAGGGDRRDPNAEAAGADGVCASLDHLEQQPLAIGDGAAIGVGAMVGPVAQESVEQVAVGAMQLDAVESGLDGAGRGVAEGLDDAANLAQFERARRRRVDEPLVGDEGLGSRPDRRRPDRRPAVLLEARVGDAAAMPKLNDDGPAFGVHGVGDGFPAADLIVRVTARRIRIALRLRRDLGRLSDDQAGRGALGVIFNGKRTRNQARAGAVSRQRRHHDAVGEFQRSCLRGLEQRPRRAGLVRFLHRLSPRTMSAAADIAGPRTASCERRPLGNPHVT